MNTELTPHIEEIKRVLGNRIDDEQLEMELNKYLNDYHVDIQSAKRGILRKYGGNDIGFATPVNAKKKVNELTGSEQNVDIVAKVVFAERRDITVKGLSKPIISGIIGDETGTASFTVWEPGSMELTKGSVQIFRNCYCKMWNDRITVNVGNRGRIESAGDVTIDVPNSGVSSSPASDVKIGDIREGMGSVNVTGKILSTESRTVNSRGETKTVYSGIIADETGKIQYSAWSDFKLKNGEVLSIKNCYIRAWKGIPQLNIGDRAELERIESDIQVDAGSSVKAVAEIVRIGGGLDITVEGFVVDVKNGSGLIKRCPECRRSVMNGTCVNHGMVEGVPDLRLKVVVDDGSGAIGAIINRIDTEALTGVTMGSAQGLAAARGEGIVAKELADRILMRRVRISGNVMSDDFGPNMIVRSASLTETDVQERAEKLLEEVEAVL